MHTCTTALVPKFIISVGRYPFRFLGCIFRLPKILTAGAWLVGEPSVFFRAVQTVIGYSTLRHPASECHPKRNAVGVRIP